MYTAIIGLIAGIAIGLLTPFSIPVLLARYTAIGILGIVDSLLGALRAETQKKYDSYIFITGLIFNLVLAVGITYLGDNLNLDLYLAAIVVFTIRIFGNLSTIRYSLLEKRIGKRRVLHEIDNKTL